MKKIILLICFVFSLSSVNAQTGFHVEYTNPSLPGWDELVPEKFAGYTYGVDYWFKLKNVRIEFFPELSLGNYKRSRINSVTEFNKIITDQLGLHFNTNFYLLDLAGDCDCPTFSKEGNFFAKGFFIQVGPGVSYFNHSLTNENAPEDVKKSSDIGFSANLGVGIDIGVSKFLTVTPIFRVKYAPSTTGEGFSNFIAPEVAANFDKTSVTTYNFGLRFGLRWDELGNKYGYR